MSLRLDNVNKEKNKLFIFGEIHSVKDRKRVIREIKKIAQKMKINYILSEELGEESFLTTNAIKEGLRVMEEQIGEDFFNLGLELNVPIIGIDLTDPSVFKHDIKIDGKLDVRKSFALREANMVKVISKWLPKGIGVMVVGDTHLRTVASDESLGPKSPIWEKFKNNRNVTFIRSPEKEIN